LRLNILSSGAAFAVALAIAGIPELRAGAAGDRVRHGERRAAREDVQPQKA